LETRAALRGYSAKTPFQQSVPGLREANRGAGLLKAFQGMLLMTPPVEDHSRVSAENLPAGRRLLGFPTPPSLPECSFSNTSLEIEFESVQNASSSLPPGTCRLL
jgi:hypothetical protein